MTLPEQQSEFDPQEREKLLAYAFRALGAKALSEAELRRKLERRSENAELVAHVLARVQELGYQDDDSVAQMEGRRTGIGRFRLQQRLKHRGLDEDLIRETLEQVNPETELQQAIVLLSRRWDSLSRKKNPKASAYGLLARRGFSGGLIWQAWDEVAAQMEGETQPE